MRIEPISAAAWQQQPPRYAMTAAIAERIATETAPGDTSAVMESVRLEIESEPQTDPLTYLRSAIMRGGRKGRIFEGLA